MGIMIYNPSPQMCHKATKPVFDSRLADEFVLVAIKRLRPFVEGVILRERFHAPPLIMVPYLIMAGPETNYQDADG